MPEKRIEEMVRAAVAQALDRQLSSLREGVVEEVLKELAPKLGKESAQAGNNSASLQKSVSAIQAGTTQKEILRSLLDNCVLYCGRAALFVVKNGSATGWHGVSFDDNDGIKDFQLDLSSGFASSVMQSRTAESGSTSDFDQRFISKFDAPFDSKAVLLPLLLKDKISALVYADAGEGKAVDQAALDVLVHATSAWLEVISQRKQAQREGNMEAAEISQPSPANDPFASHAPLHTAKAQHGTETAHEAAMGAAAGWGGPTSTPVPVAPEDEEIHRKAQRFARLLIDEIKLYNKDKLSEGRKHKDLYDRLKEDIEKSRNTYQKRYGNTAAAHGDYFNQELIRSLAEDDASLLGGNFRR